MAPTRSASGRSTAPSGNGAGSPHDDFLRELLGALQAAKAGERVRLSARRGGLPAEVARAFNELSDTRARLNQELGRVVRAVGRDGRIGERMRVDGMVGQWASTGASVNSLIDDLVRPTQEVARVISAVAAGDLSQKMAVNIEGRAVKGEFQRMGNVVNSMVDQLGSFADEVTRVAREVGTEGRLGGQADVPGVSGTWKDLTESVNFMALNLTDQVRNIAQVTTAVARGDLTQKITVEAKGEVAALAETINSMTGTLGAFADEVTRVAREVGTDGKLGGQADVPGVSGTWKDLTDNVNQLAGNLTSQVR
ncbi:MAG: HAMP domain-containing protein, partial [Acidimicrobiales bacterium]